MALSASELLLQIQSGANPSDIDTLKKMKEYINNISDISRTTVKDLQFMIQQAVVLSKTPFLSREQLSQGVSIIGEMTAKIQELRASLKNSLTGGELDPLGEIAGQREATLKQLLQTQTALNKLLQLYSNSQDKIESGEKRLEKIANQRLKEQEQYISRITAESERAVAIQEKLYQAGIAAREKKEIEYSNLVKQLRREEAGALSKAQQQQTQFENQRALLAQRILTFQQKYIRDAGAQQQFLQLSVQLKGVQNPQDLEQVRAKVNALNASLIEQQTMLGPLGRAWEKFRQIFGRVFDALVSFVAINFAYRAFTGFFESLITSNTLLEVTYARLQALIPSSQQLTEVWEKLKEVTITTPFKVEEIAKAATQMKAFGVNIKENISVVADWAAGVGQDINEVATAFGRIANFSPRTALLLTSRGFSTAALDAYVAHYGDRITALNHLIEDTFGGTARRLADTFEGLKSNIADVWVFVSQQIGKPLFEGLKRDLRFLFDLLKNLSNSSSGLLEVFGNLINVFSRTAVFLGVSVAIGAIIVQVNKLITAFQTAEGALTLFGKATLIGAAISAVAALTFGFFELKDSIDKVAEARKQLNLIQKDDFNAQEEQLQTINEELTSQLSIWNRIIAALTFQRTANKEGLQIEIDLNNEKIKQLESIRQAKQREILINNSLSDSVRDYDFREKIQELGLQDLFKNLSSKVRLQGAEIPASAHGQSDENKNQLAMNDALANWLEGQAKAVDLTKLRKQLEEDLTKEVIKFTKATIEGNPNQVFFQNILAIKEEIAEFEKLFNTSKKSNSSILNYIESLKKFNELVQGQKARFSSLDNTIDTTPRFNRIAQLEGELKTHKEVADLTMVEFENYMKNIGLTQEQLDTQIKQLETQKRLTPEQERQLAQLKEQARISREINDLLQFRKEEENDINQLKKEQYDKQLNLQKSLNDYNNSLTQLKLRTGDITPEKYGELLKESFADIRVQLDATYATIQKLQDQQSQLPVTSSEWLKKNIEIQDIQEKQVGLSKELLKIYEEIFNMPSQNFGQAWQKQLIILQNETAKWRDEIAQLVVQSGQQVIGDVFKGLLTGPTADDQQKMLDLQTQLLQIQNKEQGILETNRSIVLVEDERRKVLGEINDLQNKQANLLRDTILKVLQQIQDKLIEMASQDLMKKILGISGGSDSTFETFIRSFEQFGGKGGSIGSPAPDSGGSFDPNVGHGINARRNGVDFSSISRPIITHNVSNSRTAHVNFNGPVYGTDDFNKKVAEAQRKISRSIA